MTTDPYDEHGEILRRALQAEAESVIPSDDGLERIRARIADGAGRRSGLGRFGLGRFAFDRFTVGWARPVLAVAAAVAIAGLGVTAPQTIDLIQQSVGSKGPSEGGQGHVAGDQSSTGGGPERPDPSASDGTAAGTATASETPSSTSSPGLSSCSIQPPPAGTPTVAATPGTQSVKATDTDPCPGDAPSKKPTATQAPPVTPSPEPEEPTQAPTSPPPSETSQSAGQGGGAAGTP